MSYFLNNIETKNEFTLMYTEDYFVDKTELISKLNTRVNKKDLFALLVQDVLVRLLMLQCLHHIMQRI